MTDNPSEEQNENQIENKYSVNRRDGLNITRRSVLKTAGATGAVMSGIGALTGGAAAAPGDFLGGVELPGHSSGVGITFDGQYVYTMDGLSSTVLQIYEPPAGGDGTATVVSEKNVVDGSGNSVTLSAVEWDSSRNQLWGAYANAVYLVDIGDPADGSQDAVATFQFAPDAGGFSLIDGLAYDGRDDTLWYSPDVNTTVTHFQPDGTVIGTVQPKNADGNNIGVSGVAVGTDHNGRPTLYVGKHGPEQILRVYADDGAFINEFATTGFRIEDLACDPVTYAPNEAILTKDAYDNKYVAFEVEAGTCPIAGEEPCPAESTRLLAGQHIEIGSVTVEEDEDSLHVTYTTTGDWYMSETHLHVAEDCDDIPQTRSGNPQVGNFQFSDTHDPAVQEYTIEVPLDADLESGDELCVAAHADVQKIVDDEVIQEETAWGEGDRFTDQGNWAMHFDYEVC